MGRRCFVTVGSTRFDLLIESLFRRDVLDALKNLSVDCVIIQNGNGVIPEQAKSAMLNESQCIVGGITFHLFDYKASIKEYFQSADLILGHAGAGTCLEALECGKPFVAVINESLMDNHQTELAEKLAEDGHLLFTTPSKLGQTLENSKLFALKPFDNSDPFIFRRFMENFLNDLLAG